MGKCDECKNLSTNGYLNPICLDCALTPNFKLFEPKKQTSNAWHQQMI